MHNISGLRSVMTYSSLVLQTTFKLKSTFHFQVHTVRRRGHRVTAGRPPGGRVSTNQVTDSQRSSDLVSGWLAAIAVARHPCQQLGCEPYQLSAILIPSKCTSLHSPNARPDLTCLWGRKARSPPSPCGKGPLSS